jgi:hypothetical protein
MSVTNFKNTRPTVSPNLLIAPTEYQQRYIDQLNNALRLYFSQVDNFSQITAQQVTSNTVLIWMDM